MRYVFSLAFFGILFLFFFFRSVHPAFALYENTCTDPNNGGSTNNKCVSSCPSGYVKESSKLCPQYPNQICCEPDNAPIPQTCNSTGLFDRKCVNPQLGCGGGGWSGTSSYTCSTGYLCCQKPVCQLPSSEWADCKNAYDGTSCNNGHGICQTINNCHICSPLCQIPDDAYGSADEMSRRCTSSPSQCTTYGGAQVFSDASGKQLTCSGNPNGNTCCQMCHTLSSGLPNGPSCLCGDTGDYMGGFCSEGLSCIGQLVSGSQDPVGGASSTLTEEAKKCAEQGVCPSPYTGVYIVIKNPSADYYYGTSSFPSGSKQYISSGGWGNTSGKCVGAVTPNPPSTYSISGYLRADRDNNGSVDSTFDEGATVTGTNGNASISTTTDFSGYYRFSGLAAGTYTIQPADSANYIKKTSPKNVTVGGSKSGIDFTVVPIYSVSGSVFNDVDRDYIKDSGEGKSWSDAINISSINVNTSNNAGTISYPSSGTFSVKNLLTGTYDITYSGLPEGFSLLLPKPPTFRVTMGPGCTYSPQHPISTQRAVCSARGDITNLNFIISDSLPWIQTYGGDVRMDYGAYNKIPANPVYPSFMSLTNESN